MSTRRIALNGVLIAMCAVLGYVSIDLGNFKFTLESFPIIIGAMLFGPIDGMLVAGLGTLIYQILKWGLMSTTILWVVPYIIYALLMGLLTKKTKDSKMTIAIFVFCGIVLTLCNTVGIYLDSIIWGYYSFAYVFGSLGLRLITGVIKSVVFAIVVPNLLRILRKEIR